MKHHWNYRVIKHHHEDESWYQVHEVHYEDDKPVLYSVDHAFAWDEGDDPEKILKNMAKALKKDVLTPEDFK